MIKASQLVFAYDSGEPIIDDLDVEFARGTLSLLLGPSGSGKSTLLYLVGQMLSPSSGSLLIDEEETVSLPDWRKAQIRANKIGFVFQDALLDTARSVLDNVLEGALYKRDRERPIERALHLLDHFEVSVDPRQRPGQISGGQAQRVALCRALVHRPEIVLADEPTGNLDSDSAQVVWNALTEHARSGGTVIVATHDRTRVSLADTVVEVGRADAK